MKIKFGKYSLIYIYTWYTYQFKIIIWFLLKQNETDTEYKREKSETKTIIIKKKLLFNQNYKYIQKAK